MNTDNMPTTNQNNQDASITERIPQNVAHGTKKAIGATGKGAVKGVKKSVDRGWNS